MITLRGKGGNTPCPRKLSPVVYVTFSIRIRSLCSRRWAGKGFSLNPLTNCYDEAVINANCGLGESVVAGMASPDQFVVDKVKKVIVERKTGKKETSIWLREDGGTEERPDPRHEQLSLSDEQVLELTATITRIEKFYWKPMDTEWAFEKGCLYMLQARPIIAYVSLPDYLVTAPEEPRQLYMDAMLCVQGIHEPTSVMGTGAIRHIFGEFFHEARIGQLISAPCHPESIIPYHILGFLEKIYLIFPVNFSLQELKMSSLCQIEIN